MLYEQIRDEPRLAPSDWKTRFIEGLVTDENNDWTVKPIEARGFLLKSIH